MSVNNNYVNVAIKVGNSTQNVKIEKGCVFENNGGKYIVDENGVLNIFDKNTGKWTKTSAINMTNYQLNIFKAMANNTNEGNGIILSKADILEAQKKFKQGGFKDDMSEFLVNGYHIEKPKMSTADKYVEAYVTNGKESQSATLRFQIAELDDLKKASEKYEQEKTGKQQTPAATGRAATVSKEALKILDPDRDGKFKFDKNDYYSYNSLPIPIGGCGLDDKTEKALYAKLEALNGQKITPDLIDKLTNILLDTNNPAKGQEVAYAGEGYATESILHSVARFAQYLKPETITKLLNEAQATQIDYPDSNGYTAHKQNVKNMKTLYNRLTPAQKELYYKQILSAEANTHPSAIYTDQANGKVLADYIFEKPVSAQNYTRIKALITEMNKPNGIARTKDECKNLIETLKARGQITQAQANELYKAGKINK